MINDKFIVLNLIISHHIIKEVNNLKKIPHKNLLINIFIQIQNIYLLQMLYYDLCLLNIFFCLNKNSPNTNCFNIFIQYNYNYLSIFYNYLFL